MFCFSVRDLRSVLRPLFIVGEVSDEDHTNAEDYKDDGEDARTRWDRERGVSNRNCDSGPGCDKRSAKGALCNLTLIENTGTRFCKEHEPAKKFRISVCLGMGCLRA